jgi:hypothetical protein
MNQSGSQQQPAISPIGAPTGIELRFYYFGFFKALKRYRTTTILGWLIVAIGCASFPLGWTLGRPAGIIEIMLSCTVIVSGLGLVWQGIVTLEGYVKIALPGEGNGEQHPLVHQVLEIMKDVDDGGWQEAYGAIGKVEALRAVYSLPPLS